MFPEKLHIDKALNLYIKLSKGRSKFIFTGVRKYLLLYLGGNQEKYIAFCYLYQDLKEKKWQTGHIKDVVSLPSLHTGLSFEYKGGGLFFSCKDGKLSYEILRSIDKATAVATASDLLFWVKAAGRGPVSDSNIVLDPYYVPEAFNSSVAFEENELPLFVDDGHETHEFDGIICYLLQLVRRIQGEESFLGWFCPGIENLSYKIFNEFAFSYTTAEYLLDDGFSRKLEQMQDAFSEAISVKSGNWTFGEDQGEEEDTGFLAPLLMKTVIKMAARYQLFCRQVQSQISRVPDESYFGLRTDIDAELRGVFLKWDTIFFESDKSNTLVQLFGAFMDIGFVDHRFIIDQQNVERLVFAIETLDAFWAEGQVVKDEHWELTAEDASNLLVLNRHECYHKVTKLFSKLVRAKACSLIYKMNCFWEKTFWGIDYPKIKIIRRAGILTLDDFARKYKSDIEDASDSNFGGNYSIKNREDTDLDQYNLRVCHIHGNAVRFREWENKYGEDFSGMSVEQALTLYREYRDYKAIRITKSENLIVFSDAFLVRAIRVTEERLEQKITAIEKEKDEKQGSTENRIQLEDSLREVYRLLDNFRTFIREFRKLAEYSEKFGYMKDQDLFENSFYCPPDQGTGAIKYQQRSYRQKDIPGVIKDNWLFIASTHNLPSYPDYYKRLYDKLDDKRHVLANRLYAALPYFLDKKAYDKIEDSLRKERKETIQVLAIFATLIAFVTSFAGAIGKIDEVRYGLMAGIFFLAMFIFNLMLRVSIVMSGRMLWHGILFLMLLSATAFSFVISFIYTPEGIFNYVCYIATFGGIILIFITLWLSIRRYVWKGTRREWEKARERGRTWLRICILYVRKRDLLTKIREKKKKQERNKQKKNRRMR